MAVFNLLEGIGVVVTGMYQGQFFPLPIQTRTMSPEYLRSQ
jgi:hypothetical protein